MDDKWKDHKYIKREKTSKGSYRYYYDQPVNKKPTTPKTTNELKKRLTALKEKSAQLKKKTEDVAKARNTVEDVKNFVSSKSNIKTDELRGLDLEKVANFFGIGIVHINKRSKYKVKPYSEKDPLNQFDSKNATNDKYDSDYTTRELVNQLIESGYWDDLVEKLFGPKAKPKEEEVIKYILDNYGLQNETFSDFATRQGLYNEQAKDSAPSFDDLNRIPKNEVGKDPDHDMEMVNFSNVSMETYSNYCTDVDGDGIPDDTYDFGFLNNCAYCTLAYEYRMRGYDVEASSANETLTSNTLAEIASWYKSGSFEKTQLNKMQTSVGTEEQRGQFCVYWTGGGGHSMVYEVDSNGDLYIRDCQVNQKYTYAQWAAIYGPYTSDMYFMRTDDKELRPKSLKGVRNKRK